MRNQSRRKCVQLLQKAQNNGDLRGAKRIMAIFAVVDATLYSTIATTLKVSEESIRLWVNAFLLYGVKSFIYKKPTGRPSKLTKKQRKQLDRLISQGPQKSGFPGACWRSLMIQWLVMKNLVLSILFFTSLSYLKTWAFRINRQSLSLTIKTLKNVKNGWNKNGLKY